jgi:hypothetical protein
VAYLFVLVDFCQILSGRSLEIIPWEVVNLGPSKCQLTRNYQFEITYAAHSLGAKRFTPALTEASIKFS